MLQALQSTASMLQRNTADEQPHAVFASCQKQTPAAMPFLQSSAAGRSSTLTADSTWQARSHAHKNFHTACSGSSTTNRHMWSGLERCSSPLPPVDCHHAVTTYAPSCGGTATSAAVNSKAQHLHNSVGCTTTVLPTTHTVPTHGSVVIICSRSTCNKPGYSSTVYLQSVAAAA
jgi:hypothetical protein